MIIFLIEILEVIPFKIQVHFAILVAWSSSQREKLDPSKKFPSLREKKKNCTRPIRSLEGKNSLTES